MDDSRIGADVAVNAPGKESVQGKITEVTEKLETLKETLSAIEQQRVDDALYMEKLQKHAEKMKMWLHAHGNRFPPPVTRDGQWVNRAERRKAAKGKK